MVDELEPGLRSGQKAERRMRILDAVRDLLRESQEGAVTIEQIAERAGVAPATVYNLIGPREKVWEALAAWFMHELERRLAASGTRDALGRAREVVRSTVEVLVEDPIVSRRMLRGWEESGQFLDDSPLARLREALADAQAQGTLRSDVEVGAFAAVVGSSCVGALHQWAAGLIDDARVRARCLLALDVVLAAAAADSQRDRLLGRLRRGARASRRGQAA